MTPSTPRPSEDAAAAVNRRLRRGVLVTVGAVVLLSLVTALPFWEVIGLSALYLLLPALAFAQLPLLDAPLGEGQRIPVYVGSAATILVLGTVSLILTVRLVGWESAGLTVLPAGELVLWTLGVSGAGLAIIGIFGPLDRRLAGEGSRMLVQLIPRTSREKGVFVGLSFAAGLGEEMAYRGYALIAIQLLWPDPWAAAILSSIAFGLLHAYQGAIGIVRTAVMGVALAIPVLLTGSLLPGMAAHALIDLVAGLVIGPRWVRRAEQEALVEFSHPG